jgi:hypothetical protein
MSENKRAELQNIIGSLDRVQTELQTFEDSISRNRIEPPSFQIISDRDSAITENLNREIDLLQARYKTFSDNFFREPMWEILLIIFYECRINEYCSIKKIDFFLNLNPAILIRYLKYLKNIGYIHDINHTDFAGDIEIRLTNDTNIKMNEIFS